MKGWNPPPAAAARPAPRVGEVGGEVVACGESPMALAWTWMCGTKKVTTTTTTIMTITTTLVWGWGWD